MRKQSASITAPALTIGRLARTAGVNVETVRYYQRRGLIERPPRGDGGFRHYPAETVGRLRSIKRAQQLGFQLKEIKELLALDQGHCRDVRSRAEAKREQIAAQIQDLTALQATLDQLIRTCRSGATRTHCPIIETLSGDEEHSIVRRRSRR